MNLSLNIAKAELKTLFYSPIAWFLTIIFMVQGALTYTSLLEETLTKQQLGGNYLYGIGYLTNNLFGLYGVFGQMSRKIYLYLPLITMGLISRETSSGTIKLLYSSPVRIRQIVVGKFMAMLAYSLLLILVLSIFVVTSTEVIKSANTTAMVAGLLGMFLLLCTYSAIGLFMSCLSTYQVVAALSTLVAFAALNYVDSVWQNVEFVRSLTYYLSISSRTDRMIVGLISSKDVIYFLLITCMFLAFSMIKLQAERSSQSGIRKSLWYIATFVAVMLLGYISSMPRFIVSYDGTAIQVFTLHPNTKKIIGQLNDGPLEVTTYINLLDQYIWDGLPSVRNRDLDRWEPYLRAKHDVTLKYVYYYDYPGEEQGLMKSNPGKTLKQLAENAAKSHQLDIADFKTPEEIRKIIDLRTENNSYVIQLRYKGKSTFLRLYADMQLFPSETEVAAAMKRLTVPLPRIAFVESEHERGRDPRGERDYGVLTNGIKNRTSLVNQGFDTESISLSEQNIPSAITALVIADPQENFSGESLAKIQKYINDGGNMLITGGPGKQAILNPLIKDLGVGLIDGQLLQNDALIGPLKVKDQVVAGPTMGTVGVFKSDPSGASHHGMAPDIVRPYLTRLAIPKSWYFEGAFKDSTVVSMKGVAALSYVNNGPFHIEPLLMSDGRVSWLRKGRWTTDSLNATYSPADGDVKESFPILLALSRKVNGKEQHIAIAGNADFLSNQGLYRPLDIQQANKEVGIGLFSWFANGQFPIDTRHVPMKDDRLNLTSPELQSLKIVYTGVLPGLLMLGGALFLFRRQRQ